MGGKVEVRGTEKVLEALRNIAKRYPALVLRAVTGEAQVIMAEAVRLCPVDSGRLRASQYVKPADDEKPKVLLGFGAEYALAVHERTEVHHANGTQAKFLSAPIDAHRGSFLRDVADRVKADGHISDLAKGGL